jgi:hypothetical protein
MWKRGLLAALLVGLGIGMAGVLSRTASADDDTGRITKLVRDLGSKKFAIRDRAKRELETLGMEALEALRQAARSADLETSRRAGAILKKLEEKIERDNLLAPKKIRLNVKDAPVLDAVAELSRQSGYNIQILGDRAALATRKVTLDTGDTTFWQAFDQLCQKGGLAENTTVNPYAQPVMPGGPFPGPQPVPLPVQPVPPVKILPAPAPAVPVPAPAVPRPAPAPAVLPAPAQPPQAVPLPAPALKPAVQIRRFQLQQGAAQVQVEVKVEAQAVQAQAAPAGKLVLPAQGQAQAPAQVQVAPVQKALPPVQGKLVPAVQPPAVQPVPPVQVQPGRVVRPIRPVVNLGQMNLVDGKRPELPTAYSGAVRVRALSSPPQQFGGRIGPAVPQAAGEAVLYLEITPEPRVQNFALTNGSGVQLDKAIDDQGQSLTVPMDPMPGDNLGGPAFGRGGLAIQPAYYYGHNPYGIQSRYTHLRLKLGEKKAKTLKELSGHISAQMLAPPQALVTIDNVTKAAGKKVESGGGSIEVLSFQKQADGSYQVKFRLQTPQQFIPAPFRGQIIQQGGMPANGAVGGGVVQIGPNGRVIRTYYNTHGLPSLLDAKGGALTLCQPPTRIYQAAFGGNPTQEVTMTFRRQGEQGEPSRLVLEGQRNVSVQIPFTLRNVPLP